MADLRADIRNWLFEEFSSQLAIVFEAMAGERPSVEWEATDTPPADATLRWRQAFSGVPGQVWIAAAESDWTAAGGHIQRAAGIEEDDPAGLRATYLETIRQALSGLAQAMTARLGSEVNCEAGQEAIAAAPDVMGDAAYADVRLKLGAATATIVVGLETSLVDKFAGVPDVQEVQVVESSPEPPAEPQPDAPAPGPQSQTLDLLLDVELPVSISFGRAQVQLREVLKLITGSIVELNRSISEPVEIIVNNCVIARGEVVVVEGNFGVRVQHVVSRQERLRSLH